MSLALFSSWSRLGKKLEGSVLFLKEVFVVDGCCVSHAMERLTEVVDEVYNKGAFIQKKKRCF